MRQSFFVVPVFAIALSGLWAQVSLDPGPSVASASETIDPHNDLSVMEEAHLLMARELRRGFVRCDVAEIFADGVVAIEGPVDATVASVESGRVGLLTSPRAGTVTLRRGGAEAQVSWPPVGVGHVAWCSSVVVVPQPVQDS